MEIRKADKKDISAILAIDDLSSQTRRAEFIERSVGAGYACIALDDGHVIGYLVLEYSFFSNGFISMLVVDSKFRRQGIGSALIRHAESICETEKLFTSTNKSNLPAQAMLKDLGYVKSGLIENLGCCPGTAGSVVEFNVADLAIYKTACSSINSGAAERYQYVLPGATWPR